MTTLPDRLISEHFKNVYLSLKNQNKKFYKLIINLSINQFKYVIPDYLKNDNDVIINNTKINGPCAKLVGSIDLIPNKSLVIIIDDDIIFKNNFIEELYEAHKKNPFSVVSNFVISHKINNNEILDEPNGFGGFAFLMRPRIEKIKNFYNTMPSCAFKIDDTWFGWCFKKIDMKIIKSKVRHPWLIVLDQKNTDKHPSWYELNKNTNREKLTDDFIYLIRNNII